MQDSTSMHPCIFDAKPATICNKINDLETITAKL